MPKRTASSSSVITPSMSLNRTERTTFHRQNWASAFSPPNPATGPSHSAGTSVSSPHGSYSPASIADCTLASNVSMPVIDRERSIKSTTLGMIGVGVTSTSMQLVPPPSPPPPPELGPGSMPPPPAPVVPPVPPPMQRPLAAHGAPSHSGDDVVPATHSASHLLDSVPQKSPVEHWLSPVQDSPHPVTPATGQGPPAPPLPSSDPSKLGVPLQAGDAARSPPTRRVPTPRVRGSDRESMGKGPGGQIACGFEHSSSLSSRSAGRKKSRPSSSFWIEESRLPSILGRTSTQPSLFSCSIVNLG